MVAKFLSVHTHYTFSAQGSNFSVYAFKGYEEIHKPFEFEIEMVSRAANEDITALLGTPACLAITEMGAGLGTEGDPIYARVLFHEQGGIETTPETLQDEDKKVFSAAGNILKLTSEHSNEE